MGMDAVEIVMAVEDAFDIQIEDCEAERLVTPGQLIELVMSKVGTTKTGICLTHRSFNLLRGFFVRRCELQRKQIRPHASLRETIPPENRQYWLQQLSAELMITSLPKLVRPDWLKTLLWGLALLAGFAAAVSLGRLNSPLWLPGLLAAAIATGYIGMAVTKSCCTEFPKDVSTVGALAKWVLTHKPDLAIPEKTSWTREQVVSRVREIVIYTLGCDSTYREDARFVEDLGLG